MFWGMRRDIFTSATNPAFNERLDQSELRESWDLESGCNYGSTYEKIFYTEEGKVDDIYMDKEVLSDVCIWIDQKTEGR